MCDNLSVIYSGTPLLQSFNLWLFLPKSGAMEVEATFCLFVATSTILKTELIWWSKKNGSIIGRGLSLLNLMSTTAKWVTNERWERMNLVKKSFFQVNLFGLVTCVAEFVGGGVRPYYQISFFKLFSDVNGFGFVVLAAEILFVLSIFYYIVSLASTLKKARFPCFCGTRLIKLIPGHSICRKVARTFLAICGICPIVWRWRYLW